MYAVEFYIIHFVLRCQCIGHYVYTKLGIVFSQKSLITKIVIPFAAVILIAIQNAYPAIDGNGLQVVMYQVIAPAIQFKRRSRWPFFKLKKTGVDRVIIRNFLQGLRAERPGHLLLERPRKQGIDIVIAIINKHEPAILNVAFEMIALLRRKLDQFVSTHIAEWTLKNIGAAQLHHLFFLVDRNRRILNQ